MSNYKYFEPEQWIWEGAWLDIDSIDTFVDDMDILQEGRFYIQVGTYKEHRIYINGYWGFNKDQKTFIIQPFDCDLIFDTEQVPGNYEEAQQIIAELCEENYSLYWQKQGEYMSYFENNSNGIIKNLFECFEKENEVNYKKFIDFVGQDYKVVVYGC